MWATDGPRRPLTATSGCNRGRVLGRISSAGVRNRTKKFGPGHRMGRASPVGFESRSDPPARPEAHRDPDRPVDLRCRLLIQPRLHPLLDAGRYRALAARARWTGDRRIAQPSLSPSSRWLWPARRRAIPSNLRCAAECAVLCAVGLRTWLASASAVARDARLSVPDYPPPTLLMTGGGGRVVGHSEQSGKRPRRRQAGG